ncbi:transporter substrate-binding domain-containing protein [Ancylobacter sp.]|uniref:transporter substrate-binding domain-containing protein n=1 Tax=Ancylobacter sp. TaxID=1872567 RepID=UPI003C7E73C4
MRHIFKWLAASALSLAAVTGAQAQTAPKAITIATEGAYAPWNFTGPDGKAAGFEVDLAKDLCARMKIECTIVIQDWDGLIPALTVGKFDVIMASMFITDKRLEVIDFSRPYAIDPSSFAVAKTSALAKSGLGGKFDLNKEGEAQATIDKIKPLVKGQTIGVQAATTNQQFLKKYFDGVVDIREYKTTEQHDLDLAAGRVDGLFAQQTSLAATLAKPEYAEFEIAGPGFLGGVFGRGTGAGFRKTDTALRDQFNAAIGEAIADGTIKRLSEQWLKSDVTPPQ